MEYLIRFLIGGLVVSLFALAGDIFRPRRFSGLTGAAPTIALATLGLAFSKGEAAKISIEGRSMLLGAAAMLAYTLFTVYLVKKQGLSSLVGAVLAYASWFAVAFGLWFVLLR